MLTSLDFLPDPTYKYSGRGGRLRVLALGLLALIVIPGCAEPEPEYIPQLDDRLKPPASAAPGVPCEVAKLLASQCLGCHGQPPAAAPLALVSYADLTAKSILDPTKTVIERAILRMQDATSPMPPGPTATVTPSELVPLQNWVAAKTPMTTCMTTLR